MKAKLLTDKYFDKLVIEALHKLNNRNPIGFALFSSAYDEFVEELRKEIFD